MLITENECMINLVRTPPVSDSPPFHDSTHICMFKCNTDTVHNKPTGIVLKANV